jgi:hypothetical protein
LAWYRDLLSRHKAALIFNAAQGVANATPSYDQARQDIVELVNALLV